MVNNDDLDDKEKLHEALRGNSTCNIFHMKGETHIGSSLYSEVIPMGTIGVFHATVLAY